MGRILSKKMLLIIFAALILMVGAERVFADVSTDLVIGSDSSVYACNGATYCFHNNVGIRVTFVDKKGNRCKFNSSTGEFCGASGDKITKSVDYWFKKSTSDKDFKEIFSDWCKSYKNTTGNKKTKFERNFGSESVGVCKNNYAGFSSNKFTVNTLKGAFLDESLASNTNSGKELGKVVDKFFTNLTELYSGSTTTGAENAKKTLRKFIKDVIPGCASSESCSADIVNKYNDYVYIEIEQLLYVYSKASNSANPSVGAIGTVAEVSYILKNQSTIRPNMCFTSSGCSASALYSDGGWTGWYASGTWFTSSTTNKMAPPSPAIDGLNGSSALNPGQDLSSFYKKDTANIAVVQIDFNKITNKTCDSEAKTIANNYLDGTYSKTKYLDELKTNEKTKACFDGSGKIKEKCSDLDPDIVKKYGTTGLNRVPDACNVNCNTILTSVSDTNKIDEINKLLDEKGYTSYSLLNKDIWSEFYDAPRCDNPSYDCAPNSGIGSAGNCDINITFQDSLNKAQCWGKGVAYNDVAHKSDYGKIQSSKDNILSSNKCTVYCVETVKFNFPNSSNVNSAKAGKIFKWGIDNNVSTDKFGEMTITRTCQNIGDSSGCNRTTIKPAYWTDDNVKTKVNVKYREPVAGVGQISSVLDAKRVGNITYKDINGTTNLDSPTRVISCGSNCSNILKGSFSVTANYEFNYKSDLHWYSDKSKNNKFVSADSISSITDNYVEIGYGLPTEFTSPTVEYSIYNYSLNKYNWEKTKESISSNGYLYAEITKIGTNGHFEKLMKINAESGNDGYVMEGSTPILKYGCNYSIKNELFGSECIGTSEQPGYCKPDTSPKGIDVVFRTIELINTSSTDLGKELEKAFPGKSGTGRKIGRNWNSWLSGNPYDSTEVDNNIYNILSTNIYNKDAQYQIELTSSLIQEIRNYNRKSDKDSYIYMGDETGTSSNGYIGYYCSKDPSNNYPFCASNFISYLFGKGKISGLCIDTSNTKDRADLYKTEGCKQKWYME